MTPRFKGNYNGFPIHSLKILLSRYFADFALKVSLSSRFFHGLITS